MSNFDQNPAAPGALGGAIAEVDPGLRAHMLRVYNYMAAGVGLTALAAMLTYRLTGPELLQSPLMWVFILAPLALVFFISARIPSRRKLRGTCFSSMRRWSGCRYLRYFTSIPTPRLRVYSSSRQRLSAASAYLAIPRGGICRDSARSCLWV